APGGFQHAMEQAFYGPLGALTVPAKQRHFAMKTELPTYAAQIADLKNRGAKLVTVFGIGRVCHIAFWEPHFAAEFSTPEQWKAQPHHARARLRQHHWPGAVPGRRPDHRRRRRYFQPRHAVAGAVPAHDAVAS